MGCGEEGPDVSVVEAVFQGNPLFVLGKKLFSAEIVALERWVVGRTRACLADIYLSVLVFIFCF